MAGTKRSCCNRFCCFSSSASDEEGQDHPASAGPRSSHSAIEGTHSVASKNSEARKCEVEHVEANLNVSGPPHKCEKAQASASRKCEVEHVEANVNVSGPPHKCEKAQASASPNILQKSADENVNVNKEVSRDPGYNETPPTASTSEASKYDMGTIASIPVSSNAVPMKYEVQHADANLKAHQCDKAPATSQSFNVPQKSERANVNINQNVSGGPGCSGTPSTSSPSEATKSDLLKTIADQAKGKRLDVNIIDDLMDHISKLLKLRDEVDHNLSYPYEIKTNLL